MDAAVNYASVNKKGMFDLFFSCTIIGKYCFNGNYWEDYKLTYVGGACGEACWGPPVPPTIFVPQL